ncbi:PspC domain-containing protein [Mycetocola zhujimingii]|uniref:Phage shock protein PspC N-terminal domain-containing protein n=1 Tax=Mycetocola zhujimingii TaxID=2079792 RepID=A0A2U1TBH4_9MICO|nr:PspC domain-containing protein [Mycetocola zhujimingii]PWC06247.1 hypothetical protein DF223_11600 [Mycetocola zhujimingii]
MNEAPSTPDAPPAQGGYAPPAPQGTFFDWIRGTGIGRSDDAWLGGVAGGIARHTGLDPLIVRGVILVVALLGGPALFLYAIAWALLPDSSGRIYTERALRGIFDPAMIAIIILVTLAFLPFMQGIWWRGAPDAWNMPRWLESTLSTGWTLALIAGLIWLTVVIARRVPSSRTQAPGQPEPRSHADFWTSPAQAAPAAPTEGPTATSAGPSTDSTPDAGANATAPQGFVPTSAANPTGAEPWFATAEAAHSATDQGTRVYGAVWNPPQRPDAAEREAERRRRAAIHAEQRREHEERYRSRQPGAAFVSISLGLAVLTGVFVAIALGYTTMSETAVVIGTGSALGVLALATIIAGIRGRESGWLGFFAVVAVLALLFVGVFPRGTAVSVFGNTTWHVIDAPADSTSGFAMAAGSPTLDLSALDDPGAETGGTVDLWLAAGTVDLVLPEDAPVILEVAGGVAGISYVDDGELRENGAPLYRQVLRFGDTSDSDTTTVRIWIGAGSVDLENNARSAR